jgi:hypothetical protein
MRTLLTALLLLSMAAPALAKAPTNKDVDQSLLRLGPDELIAVNEAQAVVTGALEGVANVERDLENARLEVKSAKGWEDASGVVVKALLGEQEWVEAIGNTTRPGDLTTARAEAERNADWRRLAHEAAKQHVLFEQARLVEYKAIHARTQAELDLARMEAYSRTVQDGSVDIELGKLHAAVGRAKTNEAKAAKKTQKARDSWDGAIKAADQLAP